MNVTEGLISFSEDRVKVGKDEYGTSNFNKVYDKFHQNQDMA